MADADGQAVSPTQARIVTTRARLSRANRETRIEIQFFAQRGFLRRVEVFLGEWDRSRPPILRLHGLERGRCLCLDFRLTRFADNRRAVADVSETDRTTKRDNRYGRREQR